MCEALGEPAFVADSLGDADADGSVETVSVKDGHELAVPLPSEVTDARAFVADCERVANDDGVTVSTAVLLMTGVEVGTAGDKEARGESDCDGLGDNDAVALAASDADAHAVNVGAAEAAAEAEMDGDACEVADSEELKDGDGLVDRDTRGDAESRGERDGVPEARSDAVAVRGADCVTGGVAVTGAEKVGVDSDEMEGVTGAL